MDDQKYDASAERREFFRIEDQVTLSWREVRDDTHLEQILSIMENQTPDRFVTAATFAANSLHMNRLLNSIRSSQPDLSRYLQMLDDKLNQLAQLMVIEEGKVDQAPIRAVNLSAGGLAFFSDENLARDSLIELRLVLHPEMTGILAVGKVVNCENADAAYASAGCYRLAIEIVHMRESDRDLMVKHILRKQTAERRRELEQGE